MLVHVSHKRLVRAVMTVKHWKGGKYISERTPTPAGICWTTMGRTLKAIAGACFRLPRMQAWGALIRAEPSCSTKQMGHIALSFNRKGTKQNVN